MEETKIMEHISGKLMRRAGQTEWPSYGLLLLVLMAGVMHAEDEPERIAFAHRDRTLEFNGMVGIGEDAFGGEEPHDLVLGSFQMGYILTDRLALGRMYRGSLELTGQVWGGGQVSPESAYVVGIMPGLRYHADFGFAWVPYVGIGAGVLLTDIGEPDLSGKFQFNQQYAIGTHWFFKEDWALNLEYRLMHISNARIKEPNLGVNDHMAVVGLLYRF